MSSPWGPGGTPDPYGARPQPGPPGMPGADLQPYAGGPVDPYAGQPGPPVPAYNPYVNPGSWEPAQYLPRQNVPGTLVAGSIVGYLLSLWLFVTGMFLLFFGSVIGDSIDEIHTTLGSGGATLVVAGLGNWIALALLISGGVVATLRRPAGLWLALAGSALVVVLSVYWIVLYPDSAVVFWAVLHAIVALVPAGLFLLPPANRAWLARLPGTDAPVRPPGPQPFPTDQYGRPFGS